MAVCNYLNAIFSQHLLHLNSHDQLMKEADVDKSEDFNG